MYLPNATGTPRNSRPYSWDYFPHHDPLVRFFTKALFAGIEGVASNSHDTLPETNIAPENGWLEYDPFLLGFGPFSGANC